MEKLEGDKPMTKAELIAAVAQEAKITKVAAAKAIDPNFDTCDPEAGLSFL
jgi:nucleoid DNA-binding protein